MVTRVIFGFIFSPSVSSSFLNEHILEWKKSNHWGEWSSGKSPLPAGLFPPVLQPALMPPEGSRGDHHRHRLSVKEPCSFLGQGGCARLRAPAAARGVCGGWAGSVFPLQNLLLAAASVYRLYY